MRYCCPYVFNRFNHLVEKLNDRMDSYGSLVKLGKATEVEKRRIDVYIKGMTALKQRYFFYRIVIDDRIKYFTRMGTKSTYKNRAFEALRACHWQAKEIKERFNRLVSVQIPERYKNDFESLMYFNDRRKKEESDFMKTICDIFVSQKHVSEEIDNSIVSDCEMLGFCVCRFGNTPPYMGGCMRSDVDMLDEDEFMKKFEEGIDKYAKWLGKTFGQQAAR